MQINGLGILYTIPVISAARSSQPVNFQQNNLLRDSISISEAGKRLSLHRTHESEKADSVIELDPIAKRVDKAMKKAQEILGMMKDLAHLAQDKSLGSEDRIEIQTELEDLNDNLFMIPENLVTERNLSRDISGTSSSILQRMRERVRNGKDWNVREAYSAESEQFITQDNEGNINIEVREAGWYIVDDKNLLTMDDNGKFIESSKKIPTVKERLEALTQYVVMDSDSAEKSEALIQSQIEKIQKYRDELPDKVEAWKNDPDYKDKMKTDAYLFLWNMTRPGGVENPSLNAPDVPEIYLFGYDVYDTRYYHGGGLFAFDARTGEQIQPYGTEI